MSPFDDEEIIVLDLETVRSAEDCRLCGLPRYDHNTRGDCKDGSEWYKPIGWDNKAALGLSIGGYYSYRHRRIIWFQEYNLEETMHQLVSDKPLMVSFNGISFDFKLMRALLRQRADSDQSPDLVDKCSLHGICDGFKLLAANSYDILDEIWKADPRRKFERGLNSLDAISQANGLGPKLSHGAQAPRDWAAGKHADVINYCSDDIYKTKALFEMLHANGGWIKRGDGEFIGIQWIDEDGERVPPQAIAWGG